MPMPFAATSENNNNDKDACKCSVCARLPLRTQFCGMNSAFDHVGLYDNMDMGLFDMIGHLNEPDPDATPRVDFHTASKTADTAQRHLTHLQSELAKLGLVQQSQNFLGSSESARVIAPFQRNEVILGPRLGSGGFSTVYEVHSFRLEDTDENLTQEQHAAREYLKQHAEQRQDPASSSSSRKKDKLLNLNLRPQSRYAVKHLRYSLVDNLPKFEKAAVDLTLEAQLLLVMDHPNIVSIRGWTKHGTDSFRGGSPGDYFVILDCLPELLDDRLFTWRQQLRKYKSKRFWNRRKFQVKLKNLMVERLHVAHDICSAMEYLHERRVMNRDLKTCNVGFDADGVVQIFDLGLARLLPPESESLHDGYVMSRVGTRSTMAPEVAEKQPYGLKADVYSFGVVLWEILTLSTAGEYFRMMKRKNERRASNAAPPTTTATAAATAAEGESTLFADQEDDTVLPICPCWSPSLQELLKSCLAQDPHQRPTMTQVRQALLTELHNLGFVKAPRRRRSTFRLDLTSRATADAMSDKTGSVSSTAFASLSCDISS